MKFIKLIFSKYFPEVYLTTALFKRTKVAKLIYQLNPFNKPSGVLVYAGVNYGDGLDEIYFKYERVIAFEANPEIFKVISNKYPAYVELYNYALAESNGKVKFNIDPNPNSTSSTLGTYNDEFLKTSHSIEVNSINLGDFLQKLGVNFINYYISDIEGMDFNVLKTLEHYINNNLIEYIKCETLITDKSPYIGIGSNHISSYEKYLNGKFKIVAIGDGNIKDGFFIKSVENLRMVDYKWKNLMI